MCQMCDVCNIVKQILTRKAFNRLSVELNSIKCVIHDMAGYVCFNYSILNNDGGIDKRNAALIFTQSELRAEDHYLTLTNTLTEQLRNLLV